VQAGATGDGRLREAAPPGAQVGVDADLHAACEERVGQMTADEAGAAGDQCALDARGSPRTSLSATIWSEHAAGR